MPRNRGLRADFLPDPASEVGHDPHLLVASKSAPDTLWQQNHCGIFWSRDGGLNWVENSQSEGPARFGFCVAVDEEEPSRAWVIPAESDQTRAPIGQSLVVCRTSDGGASWDECREGLPQEACFDLVYRHAPDVASETLVFGSTNGNLYLSPDLGESWTCLASHLPPIYSVRFA